MPETIAPAVPPTPPVPLSALLAREDLALRQIAGPSDPGIVIHWAHTSEMADPYPYLLGGELLLTAGVHVPEAAGSGAYFDDYVSRIVAAGGAALGFGLAPVHDTVPRALVTACDGHGLPLLEVPPQTTFSGVARAVWQLMAQARLAELRRVTEAQQSLAAAAARPDPVPSVLQRLARHLSGRAVLYGPDGAEIAGAGRRPAPGATRALAALAQVVRPPRSHTPTAASGPSGAPRTSTGPTGASAARPASGSAGATGAAGARPDSASTPGVSAPRPTSGPASTPGVSAARPTSGSAGTQGVSATRPATGLSTAPGASATRPATGPGGTPGVSPVRPTSATDTFGDTHLAVYALGAGGDFVLGVASGEREPGGHTIASVAAVLLSLLTGEHQSGAGAARSSALVRLLLGAPPESVAALLGDGEWVVVHARPETQAPDAVAASALGAAVGSPLVDLGRNVVRVLVPAERELAAVPGWTLGVSAAVEPREWPAADLQAARALARALAMRSALVRHRGEPGIAELVPPHQARTHARALLAPLAGRPALAETLRTWLSLHGSWDRTAVALDVHRNTVRQRIARCSSLLDTDLDDPDVRMELWFALRHG